MLQQTTDRRGDIEMPVPLSRPATVALCLLVFGLGYVFSMWLLDVYRWGDQEHYANFWNAMVWAHPSQWSRLQMQYLSSSEPLYRYIIGLGAYYEFDRIKYLSFWNAMLLTGTAYSLIKSRSSLLFSFFVFTNYYMFVLIGPAERLKFAYLMFVLAFCFNGIRWKIITAILSVFAHNQAVVQFISASMYYVTANRKKVFSSRFRTIAIVIVSPILLAAAGYIFINSSGDVISQKADFYGEESQGIFEIVQWLLILACGLIVFDKRLQFLIGMLPMGFLTVLYGGRINVATLAFFCALALSRRKTAHPLVLAVMGYMSLKTIGFIMNVLDTGQGF